MAPGVKRVAVIRATGGATGFGQLGAIQTAAPTFGVEVTPVSIGSADEIERGLATFARAPNGDLILTLSAAAQAYRRLIIGLPIATGCPPSIPTDCLRPGAV